MQSRVYKQLILISAFMLFMFGCQNNPTETEAVKVKDVPTVATAVNQSLPPGGGVLMQAFYWDVPAGGTWWDHLSSKAPEWSEAGITAIWIPNPSKSESGAWSMGYDPTDYFDLGDYDQKGTVETRFGSRGELEGLISSVHNSNMEIYVDVVINHNSGGDLEWNPYANANTYTDYSIASGQFVRGYNDFHPNDYHSHDEGTFSGMADLCHHKEYVQNWLWKNSNSVAQYYRNVLGFDGWRFDMVKGFGPWVVSEWVNHAGGFAVGEYWDSNVTTLNDWCRDANASAFDFALYYAMDRAFDGGNLYELDGAGLAAVNAYRAVTFVTNHDTDDIWKKHMAYAFI